MRTRSHAGIIVELAERIGWDTRAVTGGDSGAWRIGDAERDQISDVLDEHAAEGRLTMDELEKRVGVLYAAQTREQAAAVVADLPPVSGLPDWVSAQAPPAAASPPPKSRNQQRVDDRKREQRHADEDAIGHASKNAHRAINAQLQQAAAAGNHDEAQRLDAELKDVGRITTAARVAVDAGDRGEMQRLLARLRSLA
jgi:hypothetical protein